MDPCPNLAPGGQSWEIRYYCRRPARPECWHAPAACVPGSCSGLAVERSKIEKKRWQLKEGGPFDEVNHRGWNPRWQLPIGQSGSRIDFGRGAHPPLPPFPAGPSRQAVPSVHDVTQPAFSKSSWGKCDAPPKQEVSATALPVAVPCHVMAVLRIPTAGIRATSRGPWPFAGARVVLAVRPGGGGIAMVRTRYRGERQSVGVMERCSSAGGLSDPCRRSHEEQENGEADVTQCQEEGGSRGGARGPELLKSGNLLAFPPGLARDL